MWTFRLFVSLLVPFAAGLQGAFLDVLIQKVSIRLGEADLRAGFALSLCLPTISPVPSLLSVSLPAGLLLTVNSTLEGGFSSGISLHSVLQTAVQVPNIAPKEGKVLTLQVTLDSLATTMCLSYPDGPKSCAESSANVRKWPNFGTFDAEVTSELGITSWELGRNWEKAIDLLKISLRQTINSGLNAISQEKQTIITKHTQVQHFYGFSNNFNTKNPLFSAYFHRNNQNTLILARSVPAVALKMEYWKAKGLQLCTLMAETVPNCAFWSEFRPDKLTFVTVSATSGSNLAIEIGDFSQQQTYFYDLAQVIGKPKAAQLKMPEKSTKRPPFAPLRLLQPQHFAYFAYTDTVQSKMNHFFTFSNTHKSTSSIHIKAVPSPSGDPDLYLWKNFEVTQLLPSMQTGWVIVGSGTAYSNTNYKESTLVIHPNDAELAGNGGITGLFTLAVRGAISGPTTYALTIKIVCNSLSDCQCSAGDHPSPGLDVCVACPVDSRACGDFQLHACLPLSIGSSYQGGDFQCTCGDGLYFDPATDMCESCSQYCVTCSDCTTFACLLCVENAHFSGLPSHSCECDSGFFASSATETCLSCAPSCAECSGPSQCTLCFTNAFLSGSTCVCVQNLEPATSATSCLLCAPSCATCESSYPEKCTTCWGNAHLESASPSRCVCESGYYQDSATGACGLCSEVCRECTGGQASQCTDCKDLAALEGAAPSTCICTMGAFPDITAAHCKVCSLA